MTTTKKFEMTVEDQLLLKLQCAGIKPDDAVCFFGQQLTEMMECPPNLTSKQSTPLMEIKGDYWVMRGFFPNTPVMFKIVGVYNTRSFIGHDKSLFYGKITQPVVKARHKRKVARLFSYETWMKCVDNKVNHILLNDDKPKEQIEHYRMPRCSSPKGMKIFNLKLK
jgi:hypothetical protein